MKRLKAIIAKSFKKIRVKNKRESKKDEEVNLMFKKRKDAIKERDSKKQEEFEEKIKEEQARRNIQLIKLKKLKRIQNQETIQSGISKTK